MVFGFLVQSLQKNKEPYTCLSSFFTKEGNDNQQEERHQQITALVQNEFSMRQSYEEGMSALAVGGAQQPDTKAASKKTPTESEGALFLPAGQLYREGKIVVWKRYGNTGFVLICEEDENRGLATNFLDIFVNVLIEHFKDQSTVAKPREIFNKLEEVLLLLKTYLPGGQLLFANTNLVKHLRKEFDEGLIKK